MPTVIRGDWQDYPDEQIAVGRLTPDVDPDNPQGATPDWVSTTPWQEGGTGDRQPTPKWRWQRATRYIDFADFRFDEFADGWQYNQKMTPDGPGYAHQQADFVNFYGVIEEGTGTYENWPYSGGDPFSTDHGSGIGLLGWSAKYTGGLITHRIEFSSAQTMGNINPGMFIEWVRGVPTNSSPYNPSFRPLDIPELAFHEGLNDRFGIPNYNYYTNYGEWESNDLRDFRPKEIHLMVPDIYSALNGRGVWATWTITGLTTEYPNEYHSISGPWWNHRWNPPGKTAAPGHPAFDWVSIGVFSGNQLIIDIEEDMGGYPSPLVDPFCQAEIIFVIPNLQTPPGGFGSIPASPPVTQDQTFVFNSVATPVWRDLPRWRPVRVLDIAPPVRLTQRDDLNIIDEVPRILSAGQGSHSVQASSRVGWRNTYE